MWKRMNAWWLCFVIILTESILCESSKCTRNLDCINGVCNGGFFCVCNANWWGDLCQFCRERRGESDSKLEITEGKDKYSLPTKCAWLIETDEPRNNRSVILKINSFSGPCGKRRLIIYDGSSVQSPLLAIVSDILTAGTRTKAEPLLQLRANSGSAFIVLTGKEEESKGKDCWFNITYSFEKECSINCGSHGLCTKQSGQMCECDGGWTSSNCSKPTCHVVCDDNSCDTETRKCNCTNGFTGESCNISDKRSYWSSLVANNQDLLGGVASHAMAVIGNYLWMFGGLSLSKGPLDTLARYSIKENMWEIIQASSKKHQGPSARYGHSLVAFDNALILFGGTCETGNVSNETWTFNTTSRKWTLIRNPVDKPVGVTGHTATVVGNDMIVLFGYSPEKGVTNLIQVFGLENKVWRTVQNAPSNIRPTFGHSSVLHPDTGRIYVHGGYRMLNSTCFRTSSDTFFYHPKSKGWHFQHSSSVPRFLHSAVVVGSTMIVFGGRGDSGMVSRHLMVFDIENNKWKLPSDSVVPKTASRYGHSAVAANSIMYAFGGYQGQMFNSFLQYSLGDCMSPSSSLNCFKPVPPPAAFTTLLSPNDICTSHNPQVDRCHLRQTCKDCLREDDDEDTDDGCMWCESHNQCVSKAAFEVTFPYLQCMQLLERGTGTCSGLQCWGMKSCRDCHMLPGCGWCDDGSGTGLGRCMQGGKDGPFPGSGNFTGSCSKSNWNFIDCPACQCNGHSKCVKENSCGECEDNTTGAHCEQCAKGFYGDPRNGGKCEACQCSEHAKLCAADTGDCQCLTKGVTGRNCDECDSGYSGNAAYGGSCYYSFLVSLTPQEVNLTGFKSFNFEYFPTMEKRSVQLSIEWTEDSLGSKAWLNLTTFYDNPDEGEEVRNSRELIPFEAVFPYHEYEFGHEDKFGFRGYIYDIDTGGNSAVLKVTVTQQPETIDLLEFFLTFFGCFLSLLVIAGIVWKVRNRYITFILNRQRREERQKMASRPFAKTSILLHFHNKSNPGPIAVETCENNKAAVLTVLMQLPGTEDGFAPIGQSGVCFASVLETHGDHAGSTPLGKATRIRTTKRCASTCV
ncbi:attractin-like protein 1 isoform X2 [Oculina patagonica]